MTSSPAPLRAVRDRLARLRRRVRLLLLLGAVGRWMALAIALLGAFFLADWLLDLPLGVRRFVRLGLLDRPESLGLGLWLPLLLAAAALAVLLIRARRGAAPFFAFVAAGLLGVLAWDAWRRLRPLADPLSDEDLALAVEHRFGGLGDRLAAALDFEAELRHPTRGESEAMMAAVVAEADDRVRGLAFARAASARRAARGLAWAAGAALGALVILLVLPESVGLWARRSLLLEAVAWPRATTIRAVTLAADGTTSPREADRAYEVAVGRPLTIHAEAVGDVPEEVVLVDETEGGRALERRMARVADHDGLFQVEIRDVRRPFSFVLRGGDDLDDEPRYHVEISVPPRILDLEARLAYPDYLDREEEVVQGGSLVVPQGTRVTVSFRADAEVEEASLVLPGRIVPAEPDAEGRLSAGFDADEDLRYRLLVRTVEGRENDPAQDTYDVRVQPDREPRVQWAWPRGGVETTPMGRVPLVAEVVDDHGVAGVWLEVRLPDGSTQTHDLVPYEAAPEERLHGALDGSLGRPTVRAYVPLELAGLGEETGGLLPPARLAARLVAEDSKGQRREGPWAAIDAYRELELQRSLVPRRSAVRAEFAAVRAELLSRREQVAALGEKLDDDAERDVLKSIQFAHAKIAQDLDQAARGLLGIMNTFVHGRLGAENPTGRILAILDAHLRRTYGQPPADAATYDGRLGDPVFPYPLYEEIVAAWRDRRIFDTGLLDRMLAVMEPGVRVAAHVAPDLHVLVGDALDGEATLAQVLAGQDVLLAELDLVLDRMQSWQSLGDMILLLRRIVDEQEELDSRLESLGND